MLRLKNKRASIPNGFHYVQKETQWDNSKVAPQTMWDFNALCIAVMQHRKANPSLKLNMSLPAIEVEVESVNVARIAAIPGAKEVYLMDTGDAAPSFQLAPQHSLQNLVAGAKAISAGKDILFDWEESGQPPVSQEVANKRAEICVACPKNGSGGLSRYFTIPTAAIIKSRFEKLHALKMVTPLNDRLGVCEACLCPLPLKVWTPIEFIKQHTPPDIIAALDPSCWVLSETNPIEKEETNAIETTKS